MTPTQRKAMEQALEALILNCGGHTEGKAKDSIAALRAALAEQQDAQAVPPGYKLVPVEQLDEWRQRVNTLAALGTKADRYKVGAGLKQSIRDVMDAAHSTGETHD